VVAGGVVLDPHPPTSGKEALAAVPLLTEALAGGPDRIADALLSIRSTADLGDLSRDSGGGAPDTRYTVGNLAMADSAATELLRLILDAVRRFQVENRLRPGVPKATLATMLGRDVDSISLVVAGDAQLVDEGATIRTSNFRPGLSPQEEEAWRAAQETLRAGLAVPRADLLGLDEELLHALVRESQLVRITADLVYLPEQMEVISDALAGFAGEFTVAEFRDAIGVSRRHAVPLLEWFDRQGATRRRGDLRTVRRGPAGKS
jgi:selenocysteine-specific elongation factor